MRETTIIPKGSQENWLTFALWRIVHLVSFYTVPLRTCKEAKPVVEEVIIFTNTYSRSSVHNIAILLCTVLALFFSDTLTHHWLPPYSIMEKFLCPLNFWPSYQLQICTFRATRRVLHQLSISSFKHTLQLIKMIVNKYKQHYAKFNNKFIITLYIQLQPLTTSQAVVQNVVYYCYPRPVAQQLNHVYIVIKAHFQHVSLDSLQYLSYMGL